jgi:hypothetical protein
LNEPDWLAQALRPDWPAIPSVQALCTTRLGGVSIGPYASFNLGGHVGDAISAVAENRARLTRELGVDILWLDQVHGATVVDVGDDTLSSPTADAAISRRAGRACAVLTADCLPVLLARQDGQAVGAAHAGWRGLCAGVLEATVAALGEGHTLQAWLGPAIGPAAFEVGDEVRTAFLAHDAQATVAFRPGAQVGKWMADLYTLARQRLAACGVTAVYGGGLCTHGDATRFYSYRREPVTGRMASLIWIESV